VLGYAIDHDRRALVVVPEEAAMVKLAFDLYLKTLSILEVAKRLNSLGYTQKRHTTKLGKVLGGRPWTKEAAHRVLRNPLYVGKVRQKDQLYDGEHMALVTPEVFEITQKRLTMRSAGKCTRRTRRPEFLLTGLIQCIACTSPMTSSMASSRGKLYRYYRCRKEAEEGTFCPTGLLRADEIENAVLAQLREVARSGALEERIRGELAKGDSAVDDALAQRERLTAQLGELSAEAQRLLAAFSGQGATAGSKLLVDRLGELESQMDRIRLDLSAVEVHLKSCEVRRDEGEHFVDFLNSFDDLWGMLVPQERRELVHALVSRVAYDTEARKLHIEMLDPKQSAPPAIVTTSPEARP